MLIDELTQIHQEDKNKNIPEEVKRYNSHREKMKIASEKHNQSKKEKTPKKK